MADGVPTQPPPRGRRHIRDFFADARLHPNASLIAGSVCGVRVEVVEDPLIRKIRCLDKLIDEFARGRPMAKILRD